MIIKGNNLKTIDNLNDYWHGKDFIIQFLTGTPPTADEAAVLNVDYRDGDELGRVTASFQEGHPTNSAFWTPTATGTITWVKIFAVVPDGGVTDNIVVTTDSIGDANTPTHVWTKSLDVTKDVETKFYYTYINFDIAGAVSSYGGR